MPIGSRSDDRNFDRRGQRPSERCGANPGRPLQLLAPAVEVRRDDVLSHQASQQLLDPGLRQPRVSSHDDLVDLEDGCVLDDLAAAKRGIDRPSAKQRGKDYRSDPAAQQPTPARGFDVRAPEAFVRGSGDRAHDDGFLAIALASARVSRPIRRSGTVPIDPAPSVITMSPGHTSRASAGGTSSIAGTTSTGALTAARTDAARRSSVAPGSGSSPAE